MTDERVSTPAGWTEADYDSDNPDQQAELPAVFEHESGEISVFVRPEEPDGGGDWQIEIVEGGRENMEGLDTINRGISDRASAVDQAKEMMEQIQREGVPASPADVDWKSRLR